MGGGRPPALWRLLRRLLPPLLLWRWQGASASPSSGPVGTITALATQSRQYSSTVSIAYVEPVNCTLQFDEDVVNFGVGSFQRDPDTMIFNLEQVQASEYRFQVASASNANVTIYIAPRTVRNVAGHTNNDTTAYFNFHFYAFPPSATIRLDGYQAQSTATLSNLAYLVLNSTTEFDGVQHFDSTVVSMTPAFQIRNFQQVSWDTFRFNFDIQKNSTPEASNVFCLDYSDEDLTDNDTLTEAHTTFRCAACDWPVLCASNTQYPPSGIANLEFPLEVTLQPVPALGLERTSIPLLYDTLWAHVRLEADYFAKGPLNVTVTWTEPMRDLTKVLPTFSGAGPVQALRENIVILSPSSFRMLVVPSQTGMLIVSINGTQESSDMAGNANDFRRNPETRTGDQLTVVFSAGPPAAGTVSFAYERPRELFEYQAAAAQASPFTVPSLRVSWSGFLTATYYSVWVTWGQNISTPVTRQPGPLLGKAECGAGYENCTESFTFAGFRALFGVEYTVYVRASNLWGDQVTVSKMFLHPKLNVIADGTYQVVSLPKLLSKEQTTVDFHVMVPGRAFLSMNPLKVLSFSSANKSAGDKDPCLVQTASLRCTPANLRIEVPAAQFVVFREPMRLQLTYGGAGWTEPNFRPQLRYWEAFQEEWRPASQTCPSDKVFEEWDRVHKIYSVSFCHLTQFAVFETFSPPTAPTSPPQPPRPESYEDPIFFIALAGGIIAVVLICCVWYFTCIRPGQVKKNRPLDFSEFGIRSVSDRLGHHGGAGHQKVSPFEPGAVEDMPAGRRSSGSQKSGRGQPQEESRQYLMPLPEVSQQQPPVQGEEQPSRPPPPVPKPPRRQATENLPRAAGPAPSMLPPPAPPMPPGFAASQSSLTHMESVNSMDAGAFAPGAVAG